MNATARTGECRYSLLILVMASVIGWISPARGQGGPPTADYFPIDVGAEWLYDGIVGPLTTDYQVEIDRTEFINGRVAYGFYSYLPNADNEEFFDDRVREYFSFDSAGLYLDETFVDPAVGNSYTIDWNGLNIIGPTLEVGGVKNLAGNVRLTLSILEWNGTGTGTAKVEAKENITVPAGTFSTFRVRIRYSHSLTIDEPYPDVPNTIKGSDDTTLWLAEGIGIVKQKKTRTSDAFGTQSGTFNLKAYDVSIAPSITSQPRSVTTPPCTSVTFEVAANGTPPLQYQWEKDGVAIPGAQSSSLNLNGVTSMDEGDYRVVVINSASSVTSQVAVLTVTNPPPPRILADSLQKLPDGRFRFLPQFYLLFRRCSD
jgi:hypothetical protein